MKLDWNLMRTILAHVEAETFDAFVNDADSMTQWKEGQLLSSRTRQATPPEVRVVYKHIALLKQGGYLDGVSVVESADGLFMVSLSANPSLTLSGYALLESLRADGFLEKLKGFAKERAIPLTVETVGALCSAHIQHTLK